MGSYPVGGGGTLQGSLIAVDLVVYLTTKEDLVYIHNERCGGYALPVSHGAGGLQVCFR